MGDTAPAGDLAAAVAGLGVGDTAVPAPETAGQVSPPSGVGFRGAVVSCRTGSARLIMERRLQMHHTIPSLRRRPVWTAPKLRRRRQLPRTARRKCPQSPKIPKRRRKRYAYFLPPSPTEMCAPTCNALQRCSLLSTFAYGRGACLPISPEMCAAADICAQSLHAVDMGSSRRSVTASCRRHID